MADRKQFPLRIDAEVLRAIERWAGDELRSTNGQIEKLLTEALRKSGRLPPPSSGTK
ncbi:MAG: Arc family DNA-binding protein [Planctomycetota bacterium]